MKIVTMNWDEFEGAIHRLASQIKKAKPDIVNIYGIPRGGLSIAVRLSYLLELPVITDEKKIEQRTLIVDDCIDTGKTMSGQILSRVDVATINVAVLYYNPSASFKPKFFANIKADWIVFPWESAWA